MFAKILAGTFAAITVTGAGLYIAMPGTHCNSGCPFSRTETAPVGSDSPGCCMPQDFCSSQEVPNESLAACTGATMLVSTSRSQQNPHVCCPVE